MKNLFLTFTIVYFSIGFAQNSKVTSGKLKTIKQFESKFVDSRQVDIWLPDGYSKKEKYAVLYMHDGKMLFDAAITWNKNAWEVDEIAGKLISENKTRKFIVVGVHNNGEYRHSEYFPQKMIADIPEAPQKFIVEKYLKNKPQADNYLKFLVTELKPFIDKKFSTLTDKENTYIAGASMGGLISLYAICEYPEIYGAAAGISTHLPMIAGFDFTYDVENDVASKFRDYLSKKLPNPENHRIYMDYGNKTIDAFYKPFQDKVDLVMTEKGYSDKNWITKFFPGENHSEVSWKKRLDIPLLFLLAK